MKKLCILLLTLMSLGAHSLPTIEFAQVGRFDGRVIGYAAAESPNYEAFRTEFARGSAATDLFEATLHSGTPAARLYSAIGLYGLDRSRGVAALKSLRDDAEPVTAMMGCLVDRRTVGEVATGLLKDDAAAVRSYLPR